MKTRLIVALVTGPIFLLFTMQSLPWVLFALVVVHSAAQLEFSSLVTGLSRRVLVAHVLISTVVMVAISLSLAERLDSLVSILLITLMMLVYALLACLDYERGRDHRRFILLLRSLLFVSLPLAFLPALMLAIQPVPLYLLLIGASWGADTGAIFAGKALGRTQLAPRLSPKKTVEGVIGGMLAAGLVCAGAALFYPAAGAAALPMAPLAGAAAAAYLFVCGALLSLIGLFGDLTFSLFKREAGIKDYSLVLPGHGGILDRFDSMLFVAPLIYLLARIAPL